MNFQSPYNSIFLLHRTATYSLVAQMSFQFVENNNIDEAARKRIRSHVMKGKNAGKVRPRTRQRQGTKYIPSCDDWNTTDENGRNHDVVSVPRGVGDIFSTLTFPCEFKPHMKDLLYKCTEQR
jgi:hypothetical protein